MLDQPNQNLIGVAAPPMPAARDARIRDNARPGWLRTRNVAVLAILAALLAPLSLLVLHRPPPRTLHVNVQVLSTDDPLKIGASTRARVEVLNREGHEIHPRFAVNWLPFPYYWTVTSGPSVLGPGDTGTYEIEAPASVAAPYNGQTFQISVSDGPNATFATSASVEIEAQAVSIKNPGLGLWSQRDGSDGLAAPAGWYPYRRMGDGDEATIEQVSVYGVDAAHLHILQNGEPDPGGWSHAGLAQEMPFPRKPFDIKIMSRAPYMTTLDGWPLTAFGIEINDGANGLIWVLFQPTGYGDRAFDLPNGQHVEFFDVPPGQWMTRTIDLPGMYARLKWKPTEKITVKLFIAASSGGRADIDGYIAGITGDIETNGEPQTGAE